MDRTRTALKLAYHRILSDLPQHWLDRSRKCEAEFSALSGVFLQGVSEAYLEASRRIMVVGRETRGWTHVNDQDPYLSLEDYIERAMGKHQRCLATFIRAKRDRGASYFNYLRELSTDYGPEGITWANLFAFDWNKKSPKDWPHFETLLCISERLLKAQIEVLAPDIIIFANGATSAKYRARYFPFTGENSVCNEFGYYKDQGIPSGHLWKFRLNESIQCYRIQHPSSTRKGARAARAFLRAELLSTASVQSLRAPLAALERTT